MQNKPINVRRNNLMIKIWSKNIFRVEVKHDFRNVMWGIFAFFLAGLLLLGIVRIGAIGIFNREKYRSTAELDAYTEKTIEAKRGAIYDSQMNTLSMSYGVYDFSVDPYVLRNGLENDIKTVTYNTLKNGSSGKSISKDEVARKKLLDELMTAYYKSVSKAVAFILNEGIDSDDESYISAKTVFERLNSLYSKNKDGSFALDSEGNKIVNRYQPIAKRISVEKKQKIEYLLNTCYFNYYVGLFSVTYENKPSFYDYRNDKYTPRSDYYNEIKEFDSSRRKSISGCICREWSAFILEEITKRTYPDNGYCSSFLGFVSGNSAIGGLEAYYNEVLSGKDGRISGLAVTGSGRMKEVSKAVENSVMEGGNLVLTVNPQIQKILEDNLRSTYYKHSADETYGIVMNCKTGAIYAMSNYPNFDLNDPNKLTDEENALKKAKTEIILDNTARNRLDDEGNVLEPTEAEIEERALNNQWMNFCVSYPYELGSTFKMFTASAGIEEGIIDPNTSNPFYYCRGTYQINHEKSIPCSHNVSHGSLDLGTALAKSCNGFFIHLGVVLGQDAFNKYFKGFGFTEKTGVDLSGEVVGFSRATSSMTKTELGSTAYGQTATITPIQLITAASAVANGGKLVQPYIVDKIIDSDGNLISKAETVVKRQVISEETSEIMTQKLKKVIYDSYGTAHNYFVLDGYEAAGKTGSGEIQGQGRSEGENDFKYTASFVGYAPAEDPEVIILFGIRNPKGGYLSGGEIAAPPASTIMQYALGELNIPKSTASDEGAIPDVEGLPILTAKTVLSNAGLSSGEFGGGTLVVRQNPQKGDELPDSGFIALFTDEESYEKTAVVPNFIGMTRAEAIAAAKKSGINISCNNYKTESDRIRHQSYKVDSEVYPGHVIRVDFDEG